MAHEARGDIRPPLGAVGKRAVERLTAWRGDAAFMDALIALVTTGVLLVPISVVGAVLAWADSLARHREATEVRSSSLFEALFADREDGPRAALRRRGPPPDYRSPHGGAAKP